MSTPAASRPTAPGGPSATRETQRAQADEAGQEGFCLPGSAAEQPREDILGHAPLELLARDMSRVQERTPALTPVE